MWYQSPYTAVEIFDLEGKTGGNWNFALRYDAADTMDGARKQHLYSEAETFEIAGIHHEELGLGWFGI